MNKWCTIISMALGAAGFAYMFNADVYASCLIALAVLIFVAAGFYVEGKAAYFWNNKFNKLIYFFQKNHREYNFISKEFHYTCIGENQYRSQKDLVIYPTCNTVDRITERFAWSAPSSKAVIRPLQPEHEISAMRQEQLWTFYSVYFGHICEKGKQFKTGSIIDNLIDENDEAVPFISATVDRKTKKLIMRVSFENRKAPTTAVFRVFSTKSNTEEIFSETLSYDEVAKVFIKQVDFPRQNWKYVISWEKC